MVQEDIDELETRIHVKLAVELKNQKFSKIKMVVNLNKEKEKGKYRCTTSRIKKR